ncbi:hypothetical protein VTL71DRAFT_9899 [Oculimacula yallundae]|uniref:protein-tyrosine-phosphatase n=1 Tax=Oculimacula yallundae TaxID=86028 RepID=A0ABR4BRR2_9HELO
MSRIDNIPARPEPTTSLSEDTQTPSINPASPFEMFEILPNLYLSRFPDLEQLSKGEEGKEGITHVLNMCTQPHPIPSSTSAREIEVLHIPLLDIDDITPHIPTILEFIERGVKQDGNVLVHCALGINRSAAAVIAYLCHVKGCDAEEALGWLKQRKADVRPCRMFLGQIDRWFGRQGAGEDVLVGFHRRLRERKGCVEVEREERGAGEGTVERRKG